MTSAAWNRYPRSTDPGKDVTALYARLAVLQTCLRMLAMATRHEYRDHTESVATSALELCDRLDREHQEWIAQCGVEDVRKAVMPEDRL